MSADTQTQLILMIPFLKSIAKAYASRYPSLSEICFLFPNKRSGTFFLKYLREECGRHAVLAPEVMTITDFVGMLSQRVVASRLDLLFTLYTCYREMLSPGGGEAETDEAWTSEFESFRSWGETVLSDFDEVDRYMADPAEVFRNVKDFREISSNFLTDEQKEVMLEYFGRTDGGDPSRFWKNFDKEEDDLSEVKRRFLHLWRIMSPLYDRLKESLDSRGLATNGGAYRLAAMRLLDEGRGALPYKKIVAVGFNALSTAESSIFASLRDAEGYEGYDAFADFFWDSTGPVLKGGDNSASRFVNSDIRRFPSPEWARPSLSMSDSRGMPRLRVASSPSNSAQVKIAGTYLSELRGRLSDSEITDARVAVVLPDENLLLPMLYSLPEGMGDVNLTMGYPLRLTSVVPFVALLRKLLRSIHGGEGDAALYHRDLRLFLAHPFSHLLFGVEAIGKIIGYIDRHHKSAIKIGELSEFSPEAAMILDPRQVGTSPADAISYLDRVLGAVTEALIEKGENGDNKVRIEADHINVYRDALRRLGDILEEYDIAMKPRTVFGLVDRLLASEKVGFEGEPLTGLQVMGTLETRSVDFDHIIILSMNERIMPRRARTRSFIPDTLRRAYGMPPSNYAEGIFAYYFFRMISRAKSVTMIYDASSGSGAGGGDVSRYVLQLKYLFAKSFLEEQNWKFHLSGKEPHDPSVEKTPAIRSMVEAYMKEGEGGKNFSASALNTYRECQVRFFYQNILGVNTDPESSEFVDAITAGNILHDMMLSLYLPVPLQRRYLKTPVVVGKEMIEGLLADTDSLWRLTTRTLNRLHFRMPEAEQDTPLTGAAKISGSRIMEQAMRVLRHDLSLVPFRIFGAEISETLRIPLASGRVVNFRFAIDRLDEIETGGKRRLRIVDYKTGRIKLEAGSLEEVLGGDYRSEQIFQLFTYAWLLGKRDDGGTEDVRVEIYDVPGMVRDVETLPEIGKERVESYAPYAEEFSAGMEAILNDVFDGESFRAPAEESGCAMCRLKSVCRR